MTRSAKLLDSFKTLGNAAGSPMMALACGVGGSRCRPATLLKNGYAAVPPRVYIIGCTSLATASVVSDIAAQLGEDQLRWPRFARISYLRYEAQPVLEDLVHMQSFVCNSKPHV